MTPSTAWPPTSSAGWAQEAGAVPLMQRHWVWLALATYHRWACLAQVRLPALACTGWRPTSPCARPPAHPAQDVSRVWRVAEALQYGMVGVNEVAITAEVRPRAEQQLRPRLLPRAAAKLGWLDWEGGRGRGHAALAVGAQGGPRPLR